MFWVLHIMTEADSVHVEAANAPTLSSNVSPAPPEVQAASGVVQEPPLQQDGQQQRAEPQQQPTQVEDPLSCRFCHKKLGNGGARAQHEIHCKATVPPQT